jgi:hypothetical protein
MARCVNPPAAALPHLSENLRQAGGRYGTMARMPNIAVWLTPEQTPLIRRSAAAAELAIVAAGSPVRGQSGAVATALETSSIDDLRGLLMNTEAELILLAAPGAFGAGMQSDDVDALAAATGRGVQVATFEPIPATALDLSSAGWKSPRGKASPVEALRFCPLTRLTSAFRNATEVLENFGHFRLMSIESWCRPEEGTLGGHIYAAMELVLSLMGEPETVDAAYVSPTQGTGVHMLPGESLRELRGDLSANLRFADGRAASFVASDQGGRWNRYVTLVGACGRLRIFDDGFEWLSPGGEKVDEARPAGRVRGGPPADHAVAAISDAISRLLDPAIPDPGPTDHAAVLAMGQAALLSARTGQSESPATIRRMAAV